MELKGMKAASSPAFEKDPEQIRRIFTELIPFGGDSVKRSYRLPASKEPGFSSIFINELCHKHNEDKVFDLLHPYLVTLDRIFDEIVKIFGDNECIGERLFRNGVYDNFYSFQSFNTVQKRRLDLGSGLLQFMRSNEFLQPDQNPDDFVLTLYSKNRIEWLLIDFACYAYNITNTLLYDTLGSESTEYIVNLVKSPIIVCSKDKLTRIFELKPKLPSVIGIVSMDDLDTEDNHFVQRANQLGIKLIDLKHLELLGALFPSKRTPPTPESVATITFTSGTTGVPKGAVMTHRNFSSSLAYNLFSFTRPKTNKSNKIFSFLPLAHIFERTSLIAYLAAGLTVGFPNKDDGPLTLIENLKILKPVVLVGVPRLFNRVESGIKSKTEKSKFLTKMINDKIARQQLKDEELAKNLLFDSIVVSKLRNAIGFDNIEYCISGSAPIHQDTVRFLKLALGIGFAQGYGATETCAGVLISSNYEKEPGSVGAVGPCAQMKLKSLPELNYYVEDDKGHELHEPLGEILFRGPTVFSHYYLDEKNTKLAIDEEGWYHTGDVGRIDSNGKIHIIDRVKNFFKLSQGEYIVPERIENVYLSNNSMLSQLFIHGDPTKTHLVGIVGIDKPMLESILADNNHHIPTDTDELLKIVNSYKFKSLILNKLNNDSIHKKLSGFEKIQNIHIDIEPLKTENDVLTPTMKIKRTQARKHFLTVLEQLYQEGKLLVTASL